MNSWIRLSSDIDSVGAGWKLSYRVVSSSEICGGFCSLLFIVAHCIEALHDVVVHCRLFD